MHGFLCDDPSSSRLVLRFVAFGNDGLITADFVLPVAAVAGNGISLLAVRAEQDRIRKDGGAVPETMSMPQAAAPPSPESGTRWYRMSTGCVRVVGHGSVVPVRRGGYRSRACEQTTHPMRCGWRSFSSSDDCFHPFLPLFRRATCWHQDQRTRRAADVAAKSPVIVTAIMRWHQEHDCILSFSRPLCPVLMSVHVVVSFPCLPVPPPASGCAFRHEDRNR